MDDEVVPWYVVHARCRRERLKGCFDRLQNTLIDFDYDDLGTKLAILDAAVKCIENLEREHERLLEEKRVLNLVVFDKQCELDSMYQSPDKILNDKWLPPLEFM